MKKENRTDRCPACGKLATKLTTCACGYKWFTAQEFYTLITNIVMMPSALR